MSTLPGKRIFEGQKGTIYRSEAGTEGCDNTWTLQGRFTPVHLFPKTSWLITFFWDNAP